MKRRKFNVVQSNLTNRFLHANMRLRSRYGIELDFDEYLEACETFKRRKHEVVGLRVQNELGDLEGWIKIRGKWVCAHYKLRDELIATFLPAPQVCPRCARSLASE